MSWLMNCKKIVISIKISEYWTYNEWSSIIKRKGKKQQINK